MLGQGFMRLCLGMLDPLTERFYFAPAWAKHGCKDFRVSVPCVMSASRQSQAKVVSAALSTDYHETLEELMDGEVVMYANVEDHDTSPKVVMPAPLAPGFPQTRPPTRAEYHQQRQQQAQRNAETRRGALDALSAAQAKAAHELANIAVPIGVTYSINTLKQSGRLMEGMRLDLSGASTTIAHQMEQLRATIKEDILRELRATSMGNPQPEGTISLASSAPATAGTNSAGQPEPADEVSSTPEVPVALPIKAMDRAATSVKWGNNTHLPYDVPVSWQHPGRPSYAAMAAQPAKPCLRTTRRPVEAMARSAVAIALAACLPATRAATTLRSS